MLDGPNKPGWLTRTFLSRSIDGPIRSTNKGVIATELAAELGTATRVALVFGNMTLQYESPEKEIGRKAVRWTGKVGPDAPAYVTVGEGGRLKVVPLSNLHSGASPELVWGTVGASIIYAGDLIRNMVTGKGLLERDYKKLSKGDQLRHDALMEIEKSGGLLRWAPKRATEVFAVTGNHFYDALKVIRTQQNEWGQELTGEQAMMEAADKLGAPLVPGGIDVYNASRTIAVLGAESAGVNQFDAKGGLSPYRNLIRSAELKREKDFSQWTPNERMAFLVENAFAASVTIYAREIDIDLRRALTDGQMKARTPKVLKGYYDSFKQSYMDRLRADIKVAKGTEQDRLKSFMKTVAEPAFSDVETRYDVFLSNMKEWLLRGEHRVPDRERFLRSAHGSKRLAEEVERKLIRQRAAGYRSGLEKED
jgi:hypothetical protein